MRVLALLRLFSGFEEALATGRWRPEGAPGLARLLERLGRDHEMFAVFAVKDYESGWSDSCDRLVEVDALGEAAVVLAGADAVRQWRVPRRLIPHAVELRQLIRACRIYRRVSPDLVYVGYAQLWAGAVLARVTSTPVVFRVMGVYPDMKHVLTGRGIAAALYRWAYRSPWSAVVFTQDGSGVEWWAQRALRRRTPSYFLLNGVDRPDPSDLDPGEYAAAIPEDAVVVGFLARLHPHKGCLEFAEAFIRAATKTPGLHALVIGDGPLRREMEERFDVAGVGTAVTFTNRIGHHDILSALSRVDIYVSLNRLGNLSTANLEALRLGKCVIMPRASGSTGVDEVTERLLPDDAVVHVPAVEDTDAIADAIVRLRENPKMRMQLSERTKKIADELIPTWDERIEREFAVLESTAARA